MEANIKKYQEFKRELDREFLTAANSFVKIGYLLRIARDTEILHGSGYRGLNEFAKAEYGLSKDMVSRYIRINEKYSVGGYSERLQVKYEKFGVAKLAEMLTLPDAVAEEIVPEMTKEQIQEVRREVREEEQVTDIEVALEEVDAGQQMAQSGIQKWMYQYFLDNRDSFRRTMEAVRRGDRNRLMAGEEKARILLDALAPTGVAVLKARVAGVGKLMLSIKSVKEDAVLFNVRNPEEKEHIGWQQLSEQFKGLYDTSLKIVDAWEAVYGIPYAENSEDGMAAGSIQTGEAVDKPAENVPKPAKNVPKPVNNVTNPAKNVTNPVNVQNTATGDTHENKGSSSDTKTEKVAPVQPDSNTAMPEQAEGQMEIHNYSEVLPKGEKFIPVFGEWVSVKKKPVPDTPGDYIVFGIREGTQVKELLSASENRDGTMDWQGNGIDYQAEVMFWMPMPDDPKPEEYE